MVSIVAYKDERSALWQRIAATARAFLKEQWLPALRQLAPWADVVVGK
ncbi:MAG: hypothetical protein ACJ8G7_20765 [Rhizobacter sp.]